MLVDLFIVMVLIVCNHASDCDFELTKNENVFFSLHTPIVLRCSPTYRTEPESCVYPPTFKWISQNKEIHEKKGKVKLTAGGHDVIIFDGNKSDQGTYMCDTFGNNGPINKTFNVVMIDASELQKTLLPDVLPFESSMEKKDRIYWMPEMLLSSVQQNLVRNVGENAELVCSHYTSNETEMESFKVQWRFYTNVNESVDVETLGYTTITSEVRCTDLDIWPWSTNGKCYISRLFLDNMVTKNQGHYTCAAQLSLKNNSKHSLNMTYRININVVNIMVSGKGSARSAQMNFNFNTKVCVNDEFLFDCKVSPEGFYYTKISKVISPNNYTMLVESTINKMKITNDTNHVSAIGMFISSSQINYTIRSVKMIDSGTYDCRAIHMDFLAADAITRSETVEQMILTVKQCTGKVDYQVKLWSVVSVCAVIIIAALIIIIYRVYFNYSSSYLVKTVIVQHPNKLYVPHDTCCPLIMPDVTIKTIRKHMNSSEDSLLQQKHFNRISTIPFSQKLSNYLRKSFIFGYRHVDVTGSNPDSQIIVLSNAEANKMASNSLRVEAPRPQLVLRNDSHTKYILPSNIGWIFSRDSLMFGSKIGEGAFGIVYSALVKSFSDNSDPVEVAIKTLHTSFGDDDVVNLIRELEMMKMIGHHRHIIALYGACVDNGHPYMVIELAKNGNLRDFLRASRVQPKGGDGIAIIPSSLNVANLLRFSLQIAQGMEYLSSRMIIHRDLAARNVLVDQNFDMKIADFGLTRAVENYYRKTTDGRLPIKWMAPECLLDRVYTVKSDVWSFGIVLWEIFSMGQTPYPTIQSDAMHQALRNGVRNEKPALASDEIYRLMLTIWNDDPLDRHSFSELVDKLNHLQDLEGCLSTQRDYLEISSNQCYSTTNV